MTAPDILAAAHGVEVPAAPHLRPGMIASINQGKFERHEIALGLAAIPRGARILELGAGSGFVGAVLARNTAPQAILSVEGNPDLIPHIRALHAHNGLDHLLTLRHGVVLTAPDAPETMRFFIGGNFLGSGLAEQKPDRMRPVDVPVIRYGDLRADFSHDAIMLDIEGGELDFLRHADLTGVQTFIAEMHPDVYGREGMAECRARLEGAGFTKDDRSRAGVHLYRRL